MFGFPVATRSFLFMRVLVDADNLFCEMTLMCHLGRSRKTWPTKGRFFAPLRMTAKLSAMCSGVQMKKAKALTMVELLVVTLILAILMASAMPLIRGKINSSKWSEAKTAAGTIGTAVRTYISEKGPNYNYSDIEGSLDNHSIYVLLGFSSNDLDGRYFNQADYSLSNVSPDPPSCVITVNSSKGDGPTGTGILGANGTWFVSD
jgi:type II secretory pathway pseudopilin PulG